MVRGSAVGAERKADVIGGGERAMDGGGEIHQPAVETLLIGIEMALEINQQVVTAENRAEAIAERAGIVATRQHPAQRTQVRHRPEQSGRSRSVRDRPS